jgi:hypothetical protein
MRENLEAWWFRSDNHEKMQAVVVGCVVLMVIFNIIMSVIHEARS